MWVDSFGRRCDEDRDAQGQGDQELGEVFGTSKGG